MPDAENLPATTSAPAARAITPVNSSIDVLDTARLEHMYRVAKLLASTSVVPQSLVCERQGSNWVALPEHVAVGNCLMVVEQAVRWGMSPFAVAQCASVVHGKLLFEGKLVHAALESHLGVRLQYLYNDRTGDQFGITVLGQLPGEDFVREVTGTVAEWKPAGDKSPWQHAANHRRMLVYRGTREWARLHAPGVLLGVYTADDIDEDPGAERAAQVPQRSLTPRLLPAASQAASTGAAAAEPAKSKAAKPAAASAASSAQTAAQTGSQTSTKPKPESKPAPATPALIAPPMSIEDAVERVAFPGEDLQKVLPAVLMNGGHDVNDPDYLLPVWLAVAGRLESTGGFLLPPHTDLTTFAAHTARAIQQGKRDAYLDLEAVLDGVEWAPRPLALARMIWAALGQATPIAEDA